MYVDDYIEKYSDLLGLEEWTIRSGRVFDPTRGEEAYVVRQDDERYATVYVNPAADDVQRERLVCHELLHLVLADLEFLASNGRSVDMMDAVHRALERAISQLVGGLTHHFYWVPIDPAQREAHGIE